MLLKAAWRPFSKEFDFQTFLRAGLGTISGRILTDGFPTQGDGHECVLSPCLPASGGQHPSGRSTFLLCRIHCSVDDLLMLRFSNGIYGLLGERKPSLAVFLTITSKQRRKVKTFLRNEMFIMEANIDIGEPAPTAGVKRRTQTS